MKTREDLIQENWLCRSDIMTLFKINRSGAEKIFTLAHQRDEEKLGRARMHYYGRKVSLKSAIWASGSDFNMLLKQIKSGTTPAK